MRSRSSTLRTDTISKAADQEWVHWAIRRAGGRLTGPTRQIVAILAETDGHLTADDLIDELDRRVPGTAASTVYRVLQRLDELFVIERVHSGSGAAFYHLSTSAHAHLVCTGCGVVVDVPDSAFAHLSTSLRTAHDFTINPHHCAVLGRCARCSS